MLLNNFRIQFFKIIGNFYYYLIVLFLVGIILLGILLPFTGIPATHYIVDKVGITPVILHQDTVTVVDPCSNRDVDHEAVIYGIALVVHEKYIAAPNAGRRLLTGSMEPGVLGNLSRIAHLSIRYRGTELEKGKFIAYHSKMEKYKSAVEARFSSGPLSLQQFIDDLNNNEPYIRGRSLDKTEILFLMENPEGIRCEEYRENLAVEIGIAR